MPETDKLVEYLTRQSHIEVDHAIMVYVNEKLTWRDVDRITKLGYRIQDLTHGDEQTQITLVANRG